MLLSPWLSRPFRTSALIGAALLIAGLVLMVAFPARAPELPEGFFTPVIAFEFILDKGEVYALFGPEGSPQREEMVRKMDLGNRLDFIFMALYGAFLFSFGLQAHRISGRRLYLLACLAALIVVAADVLENVQLLGITHRLAGGDFDRQLALLRFITWVKWGGIGAAFLVLLPFASGAGKPGKATAILMLTSAFLGMAAFSFRGFVNELFSLSVQATFLMMIVLCFAYRGQDMP